MFGLLVIGERHIKPTMRCYFTAIGLAEILRTGSAKSLRMGSSGNLYPLLEGTQGYEMMQPVRRFCSASHSWRWTYPLTCAAGDMHRMLVTSCFVDAQLLKNG